MKRLLWIPLLFLLAAQAWGQATPTATSTPSGPAMCSITGNVVQADGSPLVNGVITLNSQKIQVINSVVVNPTVVTTNTDAAGAIRAVSMPQGLAVQVTVCPPAQGQGQSANCSAPYSAFIPFTATTNFGQLSQGVGLSATGSLVADMITVNNSLTFPDGAQATSQGLAKLTHLAMGGPFPTGHADPIDFISTSGTIGQPAGNMGMSLTSASPPVAQGNLSFGIWNNGTTWIASAGNVSHYAVNKGETGIFMYEGLTVGNALPGSWNQYMALRDSSSASGAGLFLTNGQFITTAASGNTGAGGLCIGCTSASSDEITVNENMNNAASARIINTNAGANAQSVFQMRNDTGVLGGVGLTSSGWSTSGTYPPGATYINNTGNGAVGIVLNTGASIPNGDIRFYVDGYSVGGFHVAANQFEGLGLCGYAGFECGVSVAGLGVGNSYFSAQNWANVNISGAAYFNDGTSQWVADGGAGSGVGLYSQNTNSFSFNTGPPYSAGQNVTWTRQLSVDYNGIHFDHMWPDASAATPAITNGILMTGSRDSMGYINATAWPVTITFGRPLPASTNIGCIAIGGAGASGLYYTLNQTNTSIQIGCVNYATGPVCGTGLWFQYVCFGVG